MASCDVDRPSSDTRDLENISGTLSGCGPPDITEEHQPNTSHATVKSQKSGKFRTALTFFGVRKSMCILPSFFTGKSKNQSRLSSKKTFYKSKTHDGLSQVSPDDSLRGGSISTEDFEYQDQTCTVKLHSNECNVMSLPSQHKLQSLSRQKRGLKSFFNSFKHHKNHKNGGSDKTEMIAKSSDCQKEVAAVQDSPPQFVMQCLQSEPDVPDFATACVLVEPECTDVEEAAFEKSLEQEIPKTDLDDDLFVHQIDEINLMAVSSSECKEIGRGYSEPCLLLEMIPDPALKSETPASWSDQLDLTYGEVASLKSFDSLTGCGDIIADQEDDSITQSTVSGERSRTRRGKRASCFLTYQGGGEEMASPEHLDEQCLQGFWANNASVDPCCSCNQDHTDSTANPSCSHNRDLVKSDSAQQASAMNMSTEVLTPQSERQESVPNSDEGYYDSVTPGPDEGQDRTDQLRTDRLLRDSYSGDALYELFATDESLISPHNESKHRLPSSRPSEPIEATKCAFSDINQLQATDLYVVQDLIEVQGTFKTLELTQALQDMDWKNYNLSSKPQAAEKYKADAFEEKGNVLASSKIMNIEEKRHSNVLSTSDPDFETFCEANEQQLEKNKPVALSFRNVTSQSLDCSSLDDDQTMCFSQALVNYEKNSQMLSDMHNTCADVFETNADLTPNMEALPTIVTFDVVDMHNEGEYDEQIHMGLEEVILSPYQELEDSYLQKDAFAECDYQMVNLYEQSLICNTWAIASLPRHLGLTRHSQTMSNSLSLDRRSRSLDTQGLQLNVPDAYRESRTGNLSCLQGGRDYKGYYKKKVLMSAPEVRDGGCAMALPWQMRSEMALNHPLRDVGAKQKLFSDSGVRGLPDSKLHLSSDVPLSQEMELCGRLLHVPLPSCLPRSTFVMSHDADEDVFCKAAANLQS